jgi:hypothetical protein
MDASPVRIGRQSAKTGTSKRLSRRLLPDIRGLVFLQQSRGPKGIVNRFHTCVYITLLLGLHYVTVSVETTLIDCNRMETGLPLISAISRHARSPRDGN